MKYISIEEIISINKDVLERYGGEEFLPPTNLRQRGSLEWALYVMQNPFFFGVNRYPEIGHKAAILSWTINADQVFIDGNKRTSIAASLKFLLDNGFYLNTNSTELIEISLIVGNREITGITLDDLLDWYQSRLTLA